MNLEQATKVLQRVPSPLDLMTVKEAALTLRMHEDTIRRRIRRGQILAWGRPQRIRIEDLLPVYVPSGTQKSR